MDLIVNQRRLLQRPSLEASKNEGREIARQLVSWLEKNNKKAAKPYSPFARRPTMAMGISAPQMGIFKRVCVTYVKGIPAVFVNPRIVAHSDIEVSGEESCLSFPTDKVDCWRWTWVEVESDNVQGARRFGPQNLAGARDPWELARSICVQHEIAHLFGKLIFDFTTPNKPFHYDWNRVNESDAASPASMPSFVGSTGPCLQTAAAEVS